MGDSGCRDDSIADFDEDVLELWSFWTDSDGRFCYPWTLIAEFHLVGFGILLPVVRDKRFVRCDVLVGSSRQVRLPGSGGGVGRGNKFVLLDMTEEPEAKKLTVYNTNEI